MKSGAIVIWLWAISILVVWIVVAIDLGQPVWVRQHSIDLTAYGVFQGRDFGLEDAWKLLASQWLHVKFPHMLFNVLIIGLVGGALVSRLGWAVVLALGLIGGAAGQVAAGLFQPDAYVSGASQAYLALCGASLVLLRHHAVGLSSAIAGVIVGIILDLFVSDYGAVKPGHVVPFLIGLLVGGSVLVRARVRGHRTAASP